MQPHTGMQHICYMRVRVPPARLHLGRVKNTGHTPPWFEHPGRSGVGAGIAQGRVHNDCSVPPPSCIGSYRTENMERIEFDTAKFHPKKIMEIRHAFADHPLLQLPA